MLICCVGVNRCRLCKGCCCDLVNDVINVLVEYGEIDEDAEVNVKCSCLFCVVLICVVCRVISR